MKEGVLNRLFVVAMLMGSFLPHNKKNSKCREIMEIENSLAVRI